MKSNSVLALVLAISLLPGSIAWADGDEHHDRGEHRGQSQREHGGGDGHRDHHDYRDRHDNGPHGHDEEHRGAGPEHSFYRGDRLADEYRHRNYVVDDWRGHNLRAPPRGYQWVQTGGDYVLVAIATGVILQILLSR